MNTIDLLRCNKNLSDKDLIELLQNETQDEKLFLAANEIRNSFYGKDVYVRGLIEFTNYCKNNCYYCGIRCGNEKAIRYRMKREEILAACKNGYELGFRTFVLQGGEDPFFSDKKICGIVSEIKNKFPDCAITLSIGEKSKKSYKAFFDAGADRYLLRHEAASDLLYKKLHPDVMDLENRKKCLFDLKEIGYQVGAGFMVGAPFQTLGNIVEDLRFLQLLDPDMIGIGPFVSHHETPLADFKNGTLELTLNLIAVLRLMFPYALIPATTAPIAEATAKIGVGIEPNILPKTSPILGNKLSATADKLFFKLSIATLKSCSGLANATNKLTQAAFIEEIEPCIVELASNAVVPVMPNSVCIT